MNSQKTNDAAVGASDIGKEYLIEFDLHGLTREEVHISLNGDALYLTGVRTTLSHSENSPKAERPNGAFVRRLVLPPDPSIYEIHATIQDGVLQVHIPKRRQQEKDEAPCTVRSEESNYDPIPG